ncbi:YIP1 family protein [Paenibacillus sp. P25]|nr:YIP1 family protein [Paenibacillus sp. P25]
MDSDGNITAVDSTLKYVNQYDSSGNLLFFWGGDVAASATKLGVVKTPSAIATNSKNELFILDEENNAVQMFRLSEFGAMVHKANQLTQEGKYEESEKPWEEVLRLNAFYTPAVLGLAKAAYKKGEYEKAQKLFYEAGFVQGYSDAYWQVRLKWFQQHFPTLMNVVLIGGIALYILNKATKRSEWRRRWRHRERSKKPLVVQLKHAFYILKHPIDGFTAIRYEGKGSIWSSLIMLVLAVVSFGVMRAGTSFTFNPSVVLDINLVTVFIQFLVVWVGWVISNYLISTIYRGEGRFRDVVYGSTYALFPFVLVGLPLTLISNVMTLSEQSIYNFLSIGLMVWVAALIFWKVQGMQNYSVGEASMNIFLSLVTMTILGVLIFITFGLTNELKDFFYSVYQEVTIR